MSSSPRSSYTGIIFSIIATVLVALLVLLVYRLIWGSLAGFVSSLDHCKVLFCDFTRHYYPAGEAILISKRPTLGYFYSSLFALGLSMLSTLPQSEATVLWGAVQVGTAILLFVVPARWLLKIPPQGLPMYLLLFLTSLPLLHNFKWGQVSVIVTLGILAAFSFYQAGKRIPAAIALALVTCLKYYPALFLVYFVIKRDLRFLASFALAMFVFYLLLPASLLGPADWFFFERATIAERASATWIPTDANSQYFLHLTTRIAMVLGLEVPEAARTGLGLLGVAVLGVNIVIVWLIVRRSIQFELRLSTIALFLSLPFIITTSWPHYFVYLPFCQVGLYLCLRSRGRISDHRFLYGMLLLSIACSSVFIFLLFPSWQSYSAWGMLFISNAFLLLSFYGYMVESTRDLTGGFSKSTVRRLLTAGVLLLGWIGTWLGWRLFWFLTDDAFIAFRYISNSQLGYGYTWNPPPFRAVEGYTSFLWVFLLDLVWRVTAIEPPEAANLIALLFALGTMLLIAIMIMKMHLRPELARIRPLLLALVFAGILTNRTFLAWTSSGLETAMFNFTVTAWVYALLFLETRSNGWLFWTSLTSVFATLTRPDGLLLLAATLVLHALTYLDRQKRKKLRPGVLLTGLPFLAVLIHIVWRYFTYGEWLPNTHAAKFVAPWPESGWRYLLSFIMEYALWFWLLLVLLLLVPSVWHLVKQRPRHVSDLSPWLSHLSPSRELTAMVVVLILAAHFAYYTLIIGGDHFEYRVYSHLIPLLFVSCVWLLNQLPTTAPAAVAYLAVFILLALPLQWKHWSLSQEFTSRRSTVSLYVPLAAHFPEIVRPYVALYDELQEWLIARSVSIRHQEHRLFYDYQITNYPRREVGAMLSPDDNPVLTAGAIGVPGWVLPNTNIVDVYGLTDYVIARNPVGPSTFREMAHDRYPPTGYLNCFKPNVLNVIGDKVVVVPRVLSDAEVSECELHQWPPSYGDRFDDPGTLVDYRFVAPAVESFLWQVWPEEPLYIAYLPPYKKTGYPEVDLTEFASYDGLGCHLLPSSEQMLDPEDYAFTLLIADELFGSPSSDAFRPWTEIVAPDASLNSDGYHLAIVAPANRTISQQPGRPLDVNLSGVLRLTGYDLAPATPSPGDVLWLTLYMTIEAGAQPSHSLFVHLLGEAFNPVTGGPLWAQDDATPCRDLLPFETHDPGTKIVAKFALPIPETIPPGEYRLATGLYDWQTGERLSPLSSDGDGSVLLDTLNIDE